MDKLPQTIKLKFMDFQNSWTTKFDQNETIRSIGKRNLPTATLVIVTSSEKIIMLNYN